MCELLVCCIDLHVTALWKFVSCCMLLTYTVKFCYWLTMWQLCESLWVIVCCWLTLWKFVSYCMLQTYIVNICVLLYVADLHCEYLLLTYNVTALWKSVSCCMLLTYIVKVCDLLHVADLPCYSFVKVCELLVCCGNCSPTIGRR